jgi:hypothetical protein
MIPIATLVNHNDVPPYHERQRYSVVGSKNNYCHIDQRLNHQPETQSRREMRQCSGAFHKSLMQQEEKQV